MHRVVLICGEEGGELAQEGCRVAVVRGKGARAVVVMREVGGGGTTRVMKMMKKRGMKREGGADCNRPIAVAAV